MPTPELDHVYCCNPNLALCGTDISTMGEADHQQATCVVCVELNDTGAPCKADCAFAHHVCQPTEGATP